MEISDLRLQCCWVWVKQMGISYYFTAFKIEVRTKTSTWEYNNRAVYDCFKNPFPDDCGRPSLNLSLIHIDDSTQTDKRYCYNPDMLPDAIYIASVKSIITLTTTYDPPKVMLLTSDSINTYLGINKYKPCCGRVKRWYCSRLCDVIIRLNN